MHFAKQAINDTFGLGDQFMQIVAAEHSGDVTLFDFSGKHCA